MMMYGSQVIYLKTMHQLQMLTYLTLNDVLE
jgi:hypothetical protein